MSHVSGIVLSVSSCEEVIEDETPPPIVALNHWLVDHGKLPLVDVTEALPRGKHPQIFVYGGGYNYFPEEDFAEAVMAQCWDCPENVVLIINPEEGAAMVFRPQLPATDLADA